MGEQKKFSDYKDILTSFISSFRDDRGNQIYANQIKEMITNRKRSLTINFADLFRSNQRLAKEILQNPEEVLPLLEEEIYDWIGKLDPSYHTDVKKVHIRITNIPTKIKLRNVSMVDLNKLVSVEGIVVAIGNKKGKITKALFRHMHPNCMKEFIWPPIGELSDAKRRPDQCPICGRSGSFKLIEDKSEYVDWQRVVIQEIPEELPLGGNPRKLEIVLEDDLVDSVKLGERVNVIGVLKIKENSCKQRLGSIICDYYLKVNSIESLSSSFFEISEDDEKKIVGLSRDPRIIDRIIASILPNVQGQWEIKEAIALALFGGRTIETLDGTKLIRGNINVLIITDSSYVKYQLLQFITQVAPRVVCTTAKESGVVRLFPKITREKETGDYYLDAGALVLADGGVAVIDEIDKLRDENISALVKAMEEQAILVTEGGTLIRLSAQTTIIALGNPKHKKTMLNKSLPINLPPELLSQFDLIFPLVDDSEAEEKLTTVRVPDTHTEIIEIDMLKKYIAYARNHISPKLTAEAKRILQDFSAQIERSISSLFSKSIITTKQIIATLTRISEAYARMALRNEVTREDAERAINIMRIFLEKIGINVEAREASSTAGKPKSTREEENKLLEIIGILSTKNECAKIKDIIKEAARLGIDRQDLDRLILEMRRQGLIYEKEIDCYKRV